MRCSSSRQGHARAAVLLCHGIGETVEQWFGVQQLLAAHGVASLVFDYSGYGKSRGRVDWDQFELDTMAAFATLQKLAPRMPHSVLGFSLGSGVAAATINKLRAHRLDPVRGLYVLPQRCNLGLGS